jgi:flagellar biosynthesis protein FlhG
MTLARPLEGSGPAAAGQAAPIPNMISVASGKGGVGKTWLSIGLATAFARLGQNALLFDGDLGLANVDVQLGLTPQRDLGAVLQGRCALAEAAETVADAGFHVVAGRSGSGSLAALDPQRLGKLAGELSQTAAQYDRVLLDLGAGIERTVRFLAGRAQTCLVVTNDEPTALTDAYAFIKLLAMSRPGADVRVVVNMAGGKAEGERTYATLRKACESFLKISPPLAGIVRRDSHAREAIRNQAPLLIRHPNAPSAQDIESIARELLFPLR